MSLLYVCILGCTYVCTVYTLISYIFLLAGMYSVFRNGDENFGGVKVLLGKRSVLTMDKVSAVTMQANGQWTTLSVSSSPCERERV